MNIVFTPAATVESYFTLTVCFIGILTAMVITGLHLLNRDNPATMKLGKRCIIGALILIGVSSASYVSNYGKFISADVTAENVTLHFAGSIYKDIDLPRGNVGGVEFGFPDRGISACNITFTDKATGKRYRSAFTKNQGDTCKNLRLQIMQLLALQN